ncbi:MAG: 2-amino-4-hydroxy-6-hydroxymethyldihydropteridine diphosphokinase [Lachnospiraceae bacterium]|nr:2-amino-4-hydroxy-6-hydroxymethyldihydropteridine diphosphokinase [Lachnospiraceae bacterium]
MDKIILKDISVYAYHGCNSEEKAIGQKFLVSLVLYLNLEEASSSDDLTKTVDYSKICKTVEKVFKTNKFNLIEKCAGALADEIFLEYDMVSSLEITVKKPWVPIGCELNYAGVNITKGRHSAYLGLGSNIGERKKYIENALKMLSSPKVSVCKVSSITETKPWGKEDQANFLNCVAEIKTILSPHELLRHIQSVENALGRQRTAHWGPRTIDIDILFYDNMIITDNDLVIPHPYFEKRSFTLIPMREIAPYYVHPLLNQRIIDIKTEQEI